MHHTVKDSLYTLTGQRPISLLQATPDVLPHLAVDVSLQQASLCCMSATM